MEKEKLLATIKEDKREELNLKVLSAIQLCLTDEVLREESTARWWLKL